MKNVGTQRIETSRLVLRKFRMNDWEDMLNHWAYDEKVQHMYGEPTYTTKEEVKGLLEKYISNYEKEHTYRWAVVEASSGVCIGQIAFFEVNPKHHFAEFEYCIGRQFQNNGYITEATKAVIDYGFKEIDLNRIVISHRSDNLPSKRVIEKCGFEFEGNFRKAFNMNGEYVDRLFYALLKENNS